MDFETPRIIDLPKFKDPRGNLTFIESRQHVPFEVKRYYWVYDVPGGMWRDGHAFHKQQELIVALSGSFDVVLDRGAGPMTFHLSRPHQGLLVPAMTWRMMQNFSTNSVALMLASTPYDPNDYIEDFDEFKRLTNG